MTLTFPKHSGYGLSGKRRRFFFLVSILKELQSIVAKMTCGKLPLIVLLQCDERVGKSRDPTFGASRLRSFHGFGYVAKVNKPKEREWLSPVALVFAGGTLIGGLTLTYLQIHTADAVQANEFSKPSKQHPIKTQQSSSGDGSPNVQGVQGDVTITVDRARQKR